MAFTRFNGATATITDSAGTAIATAVGIQSFSYEAGDRAEIDVTRSTSNRREIVPGFSSPRRLTVSLLLEDPTVTELDAMLGECAAGTFAVNFGVDCAAPTQFLSLSVFLMNYSVQGEVDGVLEVSCDFMVDERPSE